MNFPGTIAAEDLDLFLKECRLAGYEVRKNREVRVGELLSKRGPKTWDVDYYFDDRSEEWYLAYVSENAPPDITADDCPACDWLKTTYRRICNSQKD